MNQMKLNHFLLSLILFLSINSTYSQSNQSCPFINAGPDQTFDCLNPCVELVATYQEILETTSYSVDTLSYSLPIPYGQAGGTGVSVNTDDVWGPIITLPFPFCYYGQTFTTCKIGSNGSILFGPTTGGGGHPWSFSASLTDSTGINGAGHVLGVYHDIDPSVCGNIKWYLVGQAPCRQFIVAFDNICHFSCNNIESRHMMVLNEGTNYIDVYVESKPTCAGWNGGNAVIGLQRITQTQGGIVAPGRNTAPDWDVTVPEAWRFKPAGNPVQAVEWYDQNNNLVGTGDTIQVCPTLPGNYTAKLSFTICGTTNISTVTDFVNLSTTPNSMDVQSQNILCNGDSIGSINITPLQGEAPFTFQLDTLTPQLNGAFSNLTAGTYNITVTDAIGCATPLSIAITEPPLLELSLVSTISTTCNLINGAFTMQTVGGVSPYMYSVDTFLNVSTTGIFENTYPGEFFIHVADANGCTDTLTIFVDAQTAITAQIQNAQNLTCFNSNDGSFDVNAFGAPTPYSYSINGAAEDTLFNFDNLEAGNYTVVVKDSNGCIFTVNQIITQPDSLIIELPTTTQACAGESFTYDAIVTGGTAPYAYLWNNANTNNPLTITPITTTTFNLKVTDSNGCEALNSLTQTLLPVPTAVATINPKEGLEPVYVTITNQSSNSSSYIWDFGNGNTQTTTNLAPINVSYPNEGTYYVTMVASNGLCSDTWTDSIMVYPVLEVEAPNVFTPNGDLSNEGYFIFTKNATGIEATIFNRWGNKIVDISDLNYKWDGKTEDGNELPEGVYFIKYKVTSYYNQEIIGHTFFHLIR
jgi:gliding motility-associated-like protein